MAQILYLGDSNASTTSGHRANALRRIGHNVEVHDPYSLLNGKPGILHAIHFKTGYIFLQKKITEWAQQIVKTATRPDIVWVDSGELLGKGCIEALKSFNCPVILYNVDDPTGKRDGNRFKTLLKVIKEYDLVVVVRKESEEECKLLGAKQVLRVFRSYDEVAHKPFDKLEDIPQKFRSDVAFVGTWMRYEGRDKFLLDLVQQQVPISIWGNRWEKSAYWEQLKPFYRGNALGGRDYVAALQGAKICLGFLSKGNRDLHTQRSLEVPFAGGLFCAERTSEHLELYKDGVEAVFWSDAQECATICKELLANKEKLNSITTAGMQRIRALQLGNEDICRKIILTLDKKN